MALLEYYRPRNHRFKAGLPLLAFALGLMVALLPEALSASILFGLAVLIAAMVQPLVVLGLALIAAPFGALESVILGGLSLDSGQILLGIALAAWVSRGFVRGRLSLPHTPLTVPLLLFCAVAFLSVAQAPDPELAIKEVVKWVEITVVMLMVADLGRDIGRSENFGDDGIWAITLMLLLAGLVQALIGIWQFALRGNGPDHFLVLDRFYRAYGTFEQPNPFGGYMNLAALLAIGILLGFTAFWLSHRVGMSRFVPKARLDWVSIVLIAVTATIGMATLLGLLFSWSRGAWMGFLAGLAVMAFSWPRRLQQGLLVFAVVAAGALASWQAELVPPSITSRVTGFVDDLRLGDVRGVDINDANYAVLERVAHWQAALDMARDHIWTGVGFGNYGPAYADYALLNWPDALGHAHNYYLNIFAELGVVGLTFYSVLWIAIFWQTRRVLQWERSVVRGVALGLMGIWTAITVHHLVDKLYVNNIYIHLGVLLGLLQLTDLHAVAGVREVTMEAEK
jgi:putative inorganic carbon (HCO3(-)) transporter